MQTYARGTRIGQYEIASLPMMGGMGVVYFALDHANNNRLVALKTFRPEFLPDRAARDRFLREGTAWVKLGSHPHIVYCYGVEYVDPLAFLVLELIAKEEDMTDATLRSWLKPGHPLSMEQALLYALQIARGMQHATEKITGLVHRDLKPENVLVGKDRLASTNINRVRVTDFGLATIWNDEIEKISYEGQIEDIKRTQLTQGLLGTVWYMAPEQWKGEQVGVYTDVYAFGCILFEMLSGQLAAVGNTRAELQASHCDGRLRPVPPGLPKDIKSLVTKCIALKPAERFTTWNKVVDKLETAYTAQSGKPAPRSRISTDVKQEERIQMGRSYLAMGWAYHDMGKAAVAVGYCERALITAQETGDRHGEAAALNTLGESLRNLGDPWKAISHYRKSMEIMREINDRPGEGAVLLNLGNAHFQLGDFRQAIGFFQQYLAIAREVDDRRGESKALSNLGVALVALGNIPQAIRYHAQSLAIRSEIGDRRGEGASLNSIGEAYRNLGDAQRAIGYYQQGLVILREIGDRRGEGAVLGNLGNAFAALGDTERAISYYQQCLDLHREIGDRRGEGNDLGNLGGVYVDLGQTEQAIRYFKKATVIRREIGDIEGVAFDSLNLANIYARQGKSGEALTLAKEAIEIFAQIGSPNAKKAEQLVDQLRSGSLAPTESFDSGFHAFMNATTVARMLEAVAEYPFMVNPDFIQRAEQLINEKAHPAHKSKFEERLNWLRKLASIWK